MVMPTTASLPVIANGDWQRQPHMKYYRAEWLNDMLVERAAWHETAPVQHLGAITIAAPGYIWFRFWLAEGERIVEKYFDEDGKAIGIYAHVGMALPQQGRSFSLVDLMLGLWISSQAHVTVCNEQMFDTAVREGIISPVEAEHAEHQIRELTTAIAGKRFPPAIVRNFAVVTK
jgi:predicted RNA-binding protein associated with RNAse of E/G family